MQQIEASISQRIDAMTCWCKLDEEIKFGLGAPCIQVTPKKTDYVKKNKKLSMNGLSMADCQNYRLGLCPGSVYATAHGTVGISIPNSINPHETKLIFEQARRHAVHLDSIAKQQPLSKHNLSGVKSYRVCHFESFLKQFFLKAQQLLQELTSNPDGVDIYFYYTEYGQNLDIKQIDDLKHRMNWLIYFIQTKQGRGNGWLFDVNKNIASKGYVTAHGASVLQKPSNFPKVKEHIQYISVYKDIYDEAVPGMANCQVKVKDTYQPAGVQFVFLMFESKQHLVLIASFTDRLAVKTIVCYHSDDAFDKMDKDEMHDSLNCLKNICHGDLRESVIEQSRQRLQQFFSQKKKLWSSEVGVGCRWEISFQTIPDDFNHEDIWMLMEKAWLHFDSYFSEKKPQTVAHYEPFLTLKIRKIDELLDQYTRWVQSNSNFYLHSKRWNQFYHTAAYLTSTRNAFALEKKHGVGTDEKKNVHILDENGQIVHTVPVTIHEFVDGVHQQLETQPFDLLSLLRRVTMSKKSM